MLVKSKWNDTNEAIGLLLTATVVVTITLLYVQWRRGRKHLYELASKLPHPKKLKPLPIIGIAHYFIGDTEKIFKNVMLAAAYPGIFGVWLSYRFFVVINTPEVMEVILNSPKCIGKDRLYRMTHNLVGEGLFSATVPVWKKHRKIIMPTFNQRILDEAVTVFSEQSEILVQQLLKTKGQTFDLAESLMKYGLDTVAESAMGIKINCQTSETSFEHSIHRCLEIMMLRMFNVPYHSDFIFSLTNLGREELREVAYFHNFINKVVINKKTEYKQRLLQNNTEAAVDDFGKRKVFIDQLIEMSENGANFTDEELRHEVATFMVAGSDTTATVAAFTVQMLALHKDIEQKVYTEVMDILGPDREVTHHDLPKLTYLEVVLKETMRLFPVGPAIVREIDEDIEIDDYILPKGGGIVISIISMHYSELYWKDPKTFDPERFTPEETAKRHRYAYLPFSGGPRNCIGMKYGMMSLKTLIATLVRRFRFETDYKSIEDIKITQALVIKAVNGHPVRAIPRN